MDVLSGKELLELARREPAEDLGEFARRLIDYITDQAMLEAVDSSWSHPSVAVGPMFTEAFDMFFRNALEGLDRINPTGAAYLRAGIRTFAESDVDCQGASIGLRTRTDL